MLDIIPRTRRFNDENQFFVPGNFERYASFQKRKPTADEFEPLVYGQPIVCGEPGCNQAFLSLLKYEEHKFRAHYHRCATCGKSYPSDRLLSIHISELHDSYFAAMSKRKPSYCCLVFACGQLFWNNAERRQHLVKEHKYHPSYDFHHPKRYLQRSKKQSNGAHSAGRTNDSAMSVCGGDSGSGGQVGKDACAGPTQAGAHVAGTTSITVGTGGNRAQRRAEKRMQLVVPGGIDSGEAEDDSGTAMSGRGQSSGGSNSRTATGKVATSSGNCSEDAMMVDGAADAAVDELTASMGRISVKVPSKISFGHRKRHGYS